eukprot:TRINITY_DN3821_c0_g1_i2.p1 TRINITY_DN3821_c0_g1~~TRINITY_DN3821_c0_g1_i2.p1  ORF type:complete len:141 (+),score=17.91 TRINITY_DN3821_c0_g1_i2:25-423(+)
MTGSMLVARSAPPTLNVNAERNHLQRNCGRPFSSVPHQYPPRQTTARCHNRQLAIFSSKNFQPSSRNKEEDIQYFVKLVAGCAGAAAAIKYGSCVFPAVIQAHDIRVALLLVFSPALAASVYLAQESRRQGN